VHEHGRFPAQQLHERRGRHRHVREATEITGVGRTAQKLLLAQSKSAKS